MEDHLSFLAWILSIFGLFYGFILIPFPDCSLSFLPELSSFEWIVLGLMGIMIAPIILEICFHTLAYFVQRYKPKKKHSHSNLKEKIPIIYSPKYNFSFWGLEKLHPFDTNVYRRTISILENKGILNMTSKIKEGKVITPSICLRTYLLDMSKTYLLKLNYSYFIGKILEVNCWWAPNCIIRYTILNTMLRATNGAITGGCLALEKGWAINLSGGYHHACLQFGTEEGYCIYPAITLSILHLKRSHPNIKNIAIIDLDAHQGNGFERDLMNDPYIYIIDFYNHDIDPWDHYAKSSINQDIYMTKDVTDSQYLDMIKICLGRMEREFTPDFILYHACTDILEGDTIGELNISSQGAIRGDELVFEYALGRKIPILMLIGGGYQLGAAEHLADVIAHLITKFNLHIL